MGLAGYLIVSAVMLACGIVCTVARKNVIYILMGIELILNAANLNLVAFSRFNGHLDGQVFAIFSIILAAAEAAVALAIVLNVFGLFDSIRPDDPDLLKE
ncbi:MAG: NADH-quinone oxidoreductase subunit NuoK [Planctomycetes bacterium]|nr:NADH-quinone oxidoreductase subunit NuoK [Planctomycetota bacterium]